MSFRTDCTRYTESFPIYPPSMTIRGDSWSFSCLWSKHRSMLEYRGNHGTFFLSRLLDKGYDPHAHRQRNESIPLYKRESNTGSASHPSEMLISCGISWRFQTKLRSFLFFSRFDICGCICITIWWMLFGNNLVGCWMESL